jgi:hypothetical protein
MRLGHRIEKGEGLGCDSGHDDGEHRCEPDHADERHGCDLDCGCLEARAVRPNAAHARSPAQR